MSQRALLIEVRWPAGRFHGVRDGRDAEPVVAEWPPSPFRLFQALVAGAYGGRWAAEDGVEKDAAFRWLEGLAPPAICAPPATSLEPVAYYVPNNDLDTEGGDPAHMAKVRTQKTLRGSLFDAGRSVAYLWTFEGDEVSARRVAELASRLHTLGHGIDAAFAHAEVLDAAEAEARLLSLDATPRRPAPRAPAGDDGFPCPTPGSLDSLVTRHAAFAGRLARVGAGRKAVTEFRQPPKAHARAVAYDRSPARLLFELAPAEGAGRFRAWPLARASSLVVAVRDQAARMLAPSWPEPVERLVNGRGARPADTALRLRILPIPSIGMTHTDPDIRRVLVEVPPDHPIPPQDVKWALAGRELADADGVLTRTILTPSSDTAMLDSYGVGPSAAEASVWRTVTPVVLPRMSGRRGRARAEGEARVAGQLAQALRYAGVTTPSTDVRVQREPFDLKGERSNRFESDRFDARDLRHVELTFARPIRGPIIIGDGRFLGLGIMRPFTDDGAGVFTGRDGVHIFDVAADRPFGAADAAALTRALRRAVMARAQAVAGKRLKQGESLPTFFTGHEQTDAPGRWTAPASGGAHAHLFYALDPSAEGTSPRLLIITPSRVDRSQAFSRLMRGRIEWLAEAVEGLVQLRAGSLGVLDLTLARRVLDDRLCGVARVWTSLISYQPTRHPKRAQDLREAVTADVLVEVDRRNLPRPDVEVRSLDVGARGELHATLRLRFAVAVEGPILLGKGSHFGAGLFRRSGEGGAPS